MAGSPLGPTHTMAPELILGKYTNTHQPGSHRLQLLTNARCTSSENVTLKRLEMEPVEKELSLK